MKANKKATIRLLDEVKCHIEGLSGPHITHFYDKHAELIKNHFFNPKFKLGVWDGKIRFFQQNGTTYQYLLDSIVPTLYDLEYDVSVIDDRTAVAFSPELIDKNIFSDINWEDSDDPIVLYEHQVRCANALLREGRGIAIAATGAGKTLIIAAVAKRYVEKGARVLIIVPSQDLIEQTRDDFIMLQLDCGEYSGDVKDIDHPIVISTWQAVQHVPTLVQEFDVIKVDEAHGLRGVVLQEILNEYGKNVPHRFGVTGTLPKEKCDALSILCATGRVLETVTAKELIDVGVLAKLDIHIEQLVEDFTDRYESYKNDNQFGKQLTYTKFVDSYFPDFASEKSYTQTNASRMEYLSHRIGELGAQGNTFVLVDGVAFGKKLAKHIQGAVFVHGKDKKKARKDIYKQFADNDNLVVIATVNIASTGINIKRIYNLVLVDIGKSYTRVVQSIGRGLRVAADKDHVDVYDLCSNLKYGKTHVAERIKLYKEAEYPHKKNVVEYEKELELIKGE